MMRCLIAVTMIIAGCSAAASDLALTVRNATATRVTSLSAYGTDGHGQPVEDNVGFAQIAIAPGASGVFKLPSLTRCQEVWLRARDAHDQPVATGTVDLCQTNTVTLSE